jgi:hypothetical protein
VYHLNSLFLDSTGNFPLPSVNSHHGSKKCYFLFAGFPSSPSIHLHERETDGPDGDKDPASFC